MILAKLPSFSLSRSPVTPFQLKFFFIKNSFIFFALFVPLWPVAYAQDDVYEVYQYDELGRLVLVLESSDALGIADVKNKAAYKYDRADNITEASSWNSNGSSAPFPPTNIGTAGYVGTCVTYWDASVGATYYLIGLSNGTTATVTGLSYSDETCPDWIRACNAQSECSERVFVDG